jgi:hypothetical protein
VDDHPEHRDLPEVHPGYEGREVNEYAIEGRNVESHEEDGVRVITRLDVTSVSLTPRPAMRPIPMPMPTHCAECRAPIPHHYTWCADYPRR